MRLSHISIARKLLLAFATVLLAIGAMGGTLYLNLEALKASDVARSVANKANRDLADLEFRLARQENSYRGFLVSSDPYYLERADSHRAKFKEDLVALREDGHAEESLRHIDAAADAWFEAVVTQGTRLARDPATRPQAMAMVRNNGLADRYMAAVEELIEVLKAENQARLDLARDKQRDATVTASWALLGGLVSALLIAAGAWFATTRAIVTPLVRLTSVMDRLVANDLTVTVDGLERRDEIGGMSRAVQVFKDNAAGLVDASAQMAAAKRSQAVVEFDMQGTVLDANENFLKVMGYSLSEVRGRQHKLFVTPAYAASPEYVEMWRKLNAGQPIAEKFRRVAKGGKDVILDAIYAPIPGPDGRPVKVVKFATDVTQAELAREIEATTQAQIVGETGKGLTALVAGDLSYRIGVDFPGEYAKLRSDFNAAMGSLEETMGVITSNAQAMQTGAGEISQAADDLSRRTEQQAATLEETAAALDEITATVRRTAEGAQRATVVVTDARQDAETSGEVVSKAVSAMGEIERSADQISQIIGVIDEIAFQTNLLALNAGVEAARAGDAGRGFAVVASEVRALAQRSAEAAKEIKALISASTGQVKEGVTLVGQTGQALGAIVGRVSEINSLMAEINASAQEQATALGQVNTAVNQMDQTTQQNAAMVEQSTAASHNLNQEAGELVRLVGQFTLSTEPPAKVAALRRPPQRAISKPVQTVRTASHRPVSPQTRGALALKDQVEWEEF
jgi:methyl-accepting chemotaxis protein